MLALDRRTVREIWRTSLVSSNLATDTFVNVLFDRGSIFAHTMGKLFCLDAETGRIKGENNLTGCGNGIATLLTPLSLTDNTAGVRRVKATKQAISNAVITGALIGSIILGS